VWKVLRRKGRPNAEIPLTLPEGSAPLPQLGSAAVAGLMAAEDGSVVAEGPANEAVEIASRVRQSTQNDLGAAANVVRLWLRESAPRP